MTRCGKILPLWQKVLNLWQVLRVNLVLGKNVEPNWANYFSIGEMCIGV